jgi:hypothetical protein
MTSRFESRPKKSESYLSWEEEPRPWTSLPRSDASSTSLAFSTPGNQSRQIYPVVICPLPPVDARVLLPSERQWWTGVGPCTRSRPV